MGYVTSYQRAQYCLRWFVTPLTHFQSCGYFVGRCHSQSSTHFPSCMSLSCYYTIDEIGWQSWLWRQEYPLLPPKMIFDSEMWHPNSASYPLSFRSFLFGPAILSALGLSLTDYANFGCPFSVYNKGDKKGEVCVSILVSRGILPVLITFATHLPPSIFADVPFLLTCVSSQHQPGEDEWGFEDAGERWLPVHTVESVVRPSLLFAADCHAR